jgi:retron-type reverse transcriptase
MSEIFNYQKVFKAYLACRKTKRGTANAIKFELDLENNLMKLLLELQTKKYVPGRSVCFVVENPTVREIFAADFRDRIVHHLLVGELEKIGEKIFIFDSFACRKKKGTHLAIKRLKKHIQRVSENGTKEAWYIQLDISGFFMSIDHKKLYAILKKIIWGQNKSLQWKNEILWLAKVFSFHVPIKNYVKKGKRSLFAMVPKRKSLFFSPKGKGLPIGNYSSQFFANVYLNDLDQFVKRELGAHFFVRYVDDFILLSKSREELKIWENKIEIFLQEKLGLVLHQKKTKLKKIEKGIDFLGYFLKPDCVLVRKRVVRNLKSKLFFLQLAKSQGKCVSSEKILATVNSYFGHFSFAFSYNLRSGLFADNLFFFKEKFTSTLEFGKLIRRKNES